jgi:hypothetical protein
MAGNGRAFGPTEFIQQRDDPTARRRPAAIRRLLQHNAADILAGNPTFLVVDERAELTAVQREGAHCNQRLIACRLRFGQFTQFDRSLAVWCVDEAEHGIPPATTRTNTSG